MAFEYLCNKHKEETENNKRVVNSIKSDKNSQITPSKKAYYNYSYKKILDLLTNKGKIFFRMSPLQKVMLVNFYKENKNSVVAMCGDGANDCGALLTADVGISLCNKVGNSVTSHFYSKDGSIACIETIIKNGKACYENSIIIIKYMIVYSIIRIVLMYIFYIYHYGATTTQYLYIDLFISLISCFLSSKYIIIINKYIEQDHRIYSRKAN